MLNPAIPNSNRLIKSNIPQVKKDSDIPLSAISFSKEEKEISLIEEEKEISLIEENNVGNEIPKTKYSSEHQWMSESAEYSQEIIYSKLILNINKEVERIKVFCASEPKALASNIGITTKDYYALWGMFLQLGGVIGFGAPESNGISLGLVGMVARPIHAGVMNDTSLKADATRKNEINDCIRYFNLTTGIQQLGVLENKLKDQKNKIDVKGCLELIQKSRDELGAEANKLQETVRAPMNKWNEQARGTCNRLRGTFVGVPSAVNAGLQTVVGGLKTQLATGQTLTGAALDLSNAASGIFGAFAILSGITNVSQAGLECYSAKVAKAALQKNEDNDKFVCATYGHRVPVLQDLARLRKDMRSLKFTVENLLYLQAGARAVNGTTSMVVGSMSIALLCGAVTATTMGSAALALALIAGAYYLFTHGRQWMETRETRALEKEMTRIAVLYGSSGSGIPGLSLASDAKGADEIADALAKVLKHEDEDVHDCKRALIEMGLPQSVLDMKEKTVKEIAKQILPYLNASSAVTEEEAIEKHYSDSKTAFAAVNILAREQERKEQDRLGKPPESAKPEHFAWHRKLASGADATDIRKSSFDKKTFLKSWSEVPGNTEFKGFVYKSLRLEVQPPITAENAWNALTQARKDAVDKAYENGPAKQKVLDTVVRWLADADVMAIKKCLRNNSGDPFKKACRETLRTYFSDREVPIENVIAALQGIMKDKKLGLDTVGMFQRARRSTDAGVSKMVLDATQNLKDDLRGKIHEDDRARFDAAMGIKDASGTIDKAELPRVMEHLEKFLFITRKLQGQKLEKVIAALHKYPTAFSGVPTSITREAAMLEIRRRYPEPVLTPTSTDAEKAKVEDVKMTMMLVKALREEKLHGRVFGAGEGSGFFIGGYKLNDKGLLVKRLLECCGKGGLPAGVLSGDLFKSLVNRKNEKISNGLFHWAKKLLNDPEMNEKLTDSIAQKLDFYYTKGALAKALRFGESDVRKEAEKVLNEWFERAKEQVKSSVALMNDDDTRDQFEVSGFISEMKTYSTLYQMRKEYDLPESREPVESISEGMTLKRERLEFYRDALLWSNAKARAKNVKAIELELNRMKEGEEQQANRFWSAKFLGVQKNERGIELSHLRAWFDELSKDPNRAKLSYKQMAVESTALVNMSKKQVYKTVRSRSDKGDHWLRWFLEQNGLSKEKLTDLKNSLTTEGSERELFASLAKTQRELNEAKVGAWVSKILVPFAKESEENGA